jgi:hypothetical protein
VGPVSEELKSSLAVAWGQTFWANVLSELFNIGGTGVW